MLELKVSSRSPAAISGAFKKIREMVSTGAVSKTTSVHLVLEAGTYRETVHYNLSNPIVIESAPGVRAEDCIIISDNCEAFHKGAENRSVFVLGQNVTKVTLKKFTIENAHSKSVQEGNTLADSAEALFWNNTTGILECENLHLVGRQNTLSLKGCSLFKKCFISGDVDFISGDVEIALFENCEISIREDNRGDFNGYAVKSQAYAGKSGFVFTNCMFTGFERKKSNIYVCRTEGKGSAASPKYWDSIALINCTISENYNPELMWDDDMVLEVYPRGNPKTGVREFKTQELCGDGSVHEADTGRRNIKSYTMTEDDFINNYASRYLIVKDTLLEQLVD